MNLVQTAKVVDIIIEEKKKKRPVGLNTVMLCRYASEKLYISPSETLAVAEKLYHSGYITYPRTESTKFSENFDIEEVLDEQRRHSLWGYTALDLLELGYSLPDGQDLGDHPPITPKRVAEQNVDLKGKEWKVYSFIVNSFFASISEDAVYVSRATIFEAGSVYKE